MSTAQTAASRCNHIKPGWAGLSSSAPWIHSSQEPCPLCSPPASPHRAPCCQPWDEVPCAPCYRGQAGTTSSAESADHRRGLITEKPQQIRQMQLGGLINQAQPGTAIRLPWGGKSRDMCYPNKAGAELGPDTDPTEIPNQHPQGHTQSSCTAVEPRLFSVPTPAVVQRSFTKSARRGLSLGSKYTELSQIISSLSLPELSTALNSTMQPALQSFWANPRAGRPQTPGKSKQPFCFIPLISPSAVLIIDPGAWQGNLSCPGLSHPLPAPELATFGCNIPAPQDAT